MGRSRCDPLTAGERRAVREIIRRFRGALDSMVLKKRLKAGNLSPEEAAAAAGYRRRRGYVDLEYRRGGA